MDVKQCFVLHNSILLCSHLTKAFYLRYLFLDKKVAPKIKPLRLVQIIWGSVSLPSPNSPKHRLFILVCFGSNSGSVFATRQNHSTSPSNYPLPLADYEADFCYILKSSLPLICHPRPFGKLKTNSDNKNS